MTARVLARAARALVVVAALALLASALLTSGPGREFLRGRIERALTEAGFEARLASLELSLWRREARLRDVTLASPGAPPFLSLRRARIRVALAALLGRPALDEVELDGLQLDLRRTPTDGRSGPAAAGPDARGAATPPASARAPAAWRLGRLSIQDATLRFHDVPSGTLVETGSVSLELRESAGGLAGELRLAQPLRVELGARRVALRVDPVPLAFARGDLRFGPVVAEADAGTLTASGSLLDALGTPRLETTLAARLDLGRVAAGAAGELRIEARASGPVDAPRAAISARSERLTWSGVSLEGVVAALGADRNGLSLDSFRARAAGGSLAGRGRWPLDDAPGALSLEWSGLQLGSLLAAAGHPAPAGRGPEARITGTLGVSWPAERWRALRASGSLAASPVAGRPLGVSGRLRFEAADEKWRLWIDEAAGAGVSLAGALEGRLAQPFAASPLEGTLRLSAADVAAAWRAFDPAAETPLAGALSGTLEVSGSLGSPRAAYRIEARDLSPTALPGLDATARVAGTLTRDAVAVTEAALEARDLRVEGAARIELATGRLSGRLSAQLTDAARLRALAPAALDPAGGLHAEASLGGTRERPTAQVQLTGKALRLAGQGFADARAQLRLGLDGLSLEQLDLTPEGGGTLRAAGRLHAEAPHEIDLSVRLENADLSQAAGAAGLARLIASLEATLRGPLDAPGTLAGELRLERLEAAAGASTLELEAPARLAWGPDRLLAEGLVLRSGKTTLEADGRLDGSPSATLRTRLGGRIEDLVALTGAPAPSEGETKAARAWREATGAIEASLVWRGSPESPVATGRVSVREGAALGLVDVALAARYDDGTLTLEELSGRGPSLTLGARGSASGSFLAGALPRRFASVFADTPSRAALHVTLEAERRERGAVGEAVASGSLAADLEADAFDARRVSGTLTLSRAVVRTEAATLEQEGTGRIEIADGQARLEGLAWRGAGSAMRLDGEARLAPGDAPLGDAQLALSAEGRFDLRLLGVLAGGMETGGTAQLDLDLTGRAAAPDLVGTLALQDGLFRYRPKRILLDSLRGRLALRAGNLEIEELSGDFNGGSFSAQGGVTLQGLVPSRGRIQASARGAILDWPRGFLGQTDADVALRVEDGAATLAGDVRLVSGSYTGNPRVAYFELEAWRALPSRPSLFDPLRFDLRVRTEQDVLADTIYGRLGLSADLTVTGRFDAPELQGRIQAAPGAELFLGGRTYTVEGLSLDYSKAGGLIPFLRTRSSTRVSGYDVTAEFTGPLDLPSGQFSSDPPLGEREIAALLTTGRATSNGASTDAVSLVAADFLGGVGRSFGLDTVRLEGATGEEFLSADPALVAAEASPQSRLTLTKRLAANLEVTLSQALAEGGTRTTLISYRPLRGVETRAVQRDDQTYAFELRHDLSFGTAEKREPSRPQPAEKPEERVVSVAVRVQDPSGRAAGLPSEASLRERLRLRAGDRFDYRRWLDDRDRLQAALAGAGFFEARIFASRDAGALSYEVRPGPRTALVFDGFEAPSGLRGQIERVWWLSEYEGSLEQDAARRTRALLVERGHVRAHVETHLVESPAAATKDLVVSVEPGPRVSSLTVAFHGNRLLPSERLRALVAGSQGRRAAFGDPESLEGSVISLAAGLGLLAAKVEARASVQGDVGVLDVAIDEGPTFTLESVALEGVSGVDAAKVLAAAALQVGDVFSEARIQKAREAVRQLYRELGFVEANVRIDGAIQPERGTVAATLKLSEGPRQVVREVVVDGDAGPIGDRLASEAGLRLGEPVVIEEWSDVRRRLYDTGLLKGVELRAEPLEGAGSEGGGTQPVRAHLTLSGWPALRLRYGLQLAGTRDPTEEEGRQQFRLGGIAEASRQTLFGRAIGAGVSAQGRKGFLLGRGYLSTAKSFGAPLRSSLFVTRTRSDLPIVLLGFRSVLQRDTTETILEERFRPRGPFELAASYGLNWTRLHGDIFFVGPIEQRLRTARLIGTALLDRRDNVIDPLRGYFHATSFEYGAPALGSEFTFKRLFVQQYGYLPLGRALFATGLRLERASGHDQSLLVSGRLAAGGASSVRGYPEDFDTGIGGDQDVVSTLLVLNEELRFPILGSLFGGAFFDHASRWDQGLGRVLERSSVGFGLRYRTSVGVLRLDFGYPLVGSDRKGRFYFALGQAF